MPYDEASSIEPSFSSNVCETLSPVKSQTWNLHGRTDIVCVKLSSQGEIEILINAILSSHFYF